MMNSSKKISVILCAAGKGERAGFSKNKVLIPLQGISPLERSLCAFLPFADEIVISANPDDFSEIAYLEKKYPIVKIVFGGETRMRSVFNALQKATGEIVLIHDAARPFIEKSSITSCLQSVQKYGSGICAIPAINTIGIVENDEISNFTNRKNTYQIQTPQGFLFQEIYTAYQNAFKDDRTNFTDDSSLFKAYGGIPHLAQGTESNIKLTYPTDFENTFAKCGFGVDTHAFGAISDSLVLAGVKIPYKSGLIAHSDGDVVVHSLMDALLSSVGLYDIGHYFPDTDDTYKNANSIEMLKQVLKMVNKEGFCVKNVSIAIQAEEPKLKDYIDRMRQNLATTLKIPVYNVGISAGTNEKLGYVGECKGITVYSYVLLKNI